jgi:hypothetical protein
VRSPVNLKGWCCEEIIAPNGRRESIPRGISARTRIALPPAVCGAPAPCLPGRTSQIGRPSFLSSDPQKAVAVGCLNSTTHRMAFVGGFTYWPLQIALYIFYHVLQSRFLIAYQNGCEHLYKSAVPIYLLVEDSRSELVVCNWPRKP